eukprot:CAMPEP_0177453094 /NCGR_PEP_ID=MMETSP0369-20130122/10652_1 /TAXON_ID=447022 ORGANISM="Scrippsiella hangoei-like, Strain SHHI-4" /NCGR_SAMPLE_ID=MMETSP0369 /ASSEMBLY_ACC=CAM_ASM_000364 /LENGTH=104 /DNA_ID=CAMNT_0018925799 /DNA_START=140 /DNA_END=454 /DNA_ORIENTATION=+
MRNPLEAFSFCSALFGAPLRAGAFDAARVAAPPAWTERATSLGWLAVARRRVDYIPDGAQDLAALHTVTFSDKTDADRVLSSPITTCRFEGEEPRKIRILCHEG